jgi:hypothetical protein
VPHVSLPSPDENAVVLKGDLVPDTEVLRNEAFEFFRGLTEDFNTNSQLYWSFVFEGATIDNAEVLSSTLSGLGFSDVEIIATEDIDPDDIENAKLGLFARERKVHTAESFAQRVVSCQRFADQNNLEMVDFSAGLE